MATRALRLLPETLITALALGLRLHFVLAEPQVSVYGDQASYMRTALAIGHYVTGEPLETYRAQQFFIRGPVLPLIYDAAFLTHAFLHWDELGGLNNAALTFDWRLLRIWQTLVDGIGCIALMIIARRLFQPRTARLAGLLYAIYPSLVFSVGRPLPQAWAVPMLLVGTALLVSSPGTRSWMRYALAGLVQGLTRQTMPATIGVISVWLLTQIYVDWRTRALGRRTARAVFSLLTSYIGVALLVSAGQHVLLGRHNTADPIGDQYVATFWHHLPTDGWPPDDGTISQEFQAYLDSPPDSLFAQLRMELSVFRSKPLDMARVFLANIYRLWAEPANPFQQSHLFWTPKGIRVFHVLLVPLALLGLAFIGLPADFRLLLPGYLAYFTLLYANVHVETRYSLIWLPFTLLLAAHALERLASQASKRVRHSTRRVVVLSAAAGLLGSLFLVRPAVLLLLVPHWSPLAAQLVRMIAVGASGVVLAASLLPVGMLRQNALGQRLLSSLSLVAFGLAQYHATFRLQPWRVWSAKLAGPEAVIQQTIWLPAQVPEAPTYLFVDAVSADFGPLEVRVNGTIIKARGESIPAPPLPPFSDYMAWLTVQGKAAEQLPHWLVLPLSDGLVAPGAKTMIEIRLGSDEPDAHVQINGTYAAPPANHYRGPAFTDGLVDMSWYKLFWDGDPRLMRSYSLESMTTTSAWSTDRGRTWNTDDLSPDWGLQNGNYRIRLVFYRPYYPVVY